MKKNMLFVVVAMIITMFALTACGEKFNLKKETGISWQDAVKYHVGGSGEADPADEFSSRTAVDHDSRFITDNVDLDPKGCFPEISDAGWTFLSDWSAQWLAPTRIEWQVVESRCSWVFPGNITDNITEQDYKAVVDVLASFGYSQTWFVGGDEGQEFGRRTYTEIIAADPSFNRVHVYGNQLAEMPTMTQASPEAKPATKATK